MSERNIVFQYLMRTYCDNNLDYAAEITGWQKHQIQAWMDNDCCPQNATLNYFLHVLLVPQFTIVVEFGDFFSEKALKPQLRQLLHGYAESPGLYAFYDSLRNLLYVGKTKNLLKRCCSSLQSNLDETNFPVGIENVPTQRYQIVRYISAYYVGESDWMDYPEHVESLILRISKPLLNKKIGFLERAYPELNEE